MVDIIGVMAGLMSEDMFGGRRPTRRSLPSKLGACWSPADRRCVGEPQGQS